MQIKNKQQFVGLTISRIATIDSGARIGVTFSNADHAVLEFKNGHQRVSADGRFDHRQSYKLKGNANEDC